jgi:hypothetical protein
MLVHMTPKEVGGLQALAMQHGGSLSINPKTGLPEADFLKNILPTLLGAALTVGTGGVINPLTAGMIVGGGTAVATGDLSKGLMAGLGAYGGAGLGAGLSAAGASAGASAAAPTGLEFADAASPDFLASQGASAAPTAITPSTAPIAPTIGDTGAAIYGGTPSQAMELANLGVDPMAVTGDSSRVLTGTGQTAPTAMDNFAQAGRGFKNLFTEEGAFKDFIGQAATKADEKKGVEATKATGLGGPMAALQTTAMAGAPVIADALTPEPFKMPEEEKSKYAGPYTPTERRVSYPGDDLRRRTSEYMYFTPSNPVPYAEGGETTAGSSPDIFVSPGEARVYQDIMNVQRLAGLPALDPSRFAVSPGRNYERFVYNPAETSATQGIGPEANYGFRAIERVNDPDVTGLTEESFGFTKDYNLPTPQYTFDAASQTITPSQSYLDAIEAARKARQPVYSDSFAKGGVPMLEDGGFVLTKKAVDGLGKGDNKRGQQVASAGLGAIPIKGAGAKRGPKAGVDDKIKTSIEGKRPALVSNGESYVPKKQVAKHGGAKKFYALMKKAERRA